MAVTDMKISDSTLFFASDNFFEQQSLLTNEKTREQLLARHNNALGTGTDSGKGLFVHIDRDVVLKNIMQQKEQVSEGGSEPSGSDNGAAVSDHRGGSGMMTQISLHSARIHFEQEKMHVESSLWTKNKEGELI
jgi:hypothetical protein